MPSWSVMPTAIPTTAYMMKYGYGDASRNSTWLMTVASMYLWRMSKGVYRFAPEVYAALIAQPIDGEIPVEFFHRLPEWAVYIETPGYAFDGSEIDGFVAHLDYSLMEHATDLQLLLFKRGVPEKRPVALPLRGGTLDDALRRLDKYDAEELGRVGKKSERLAATMHRDFAPLLQLVLYLCSDEPDMPRVQHPRERMRASGAVDAPREPRIWDVGVRIGAAIRGYAVAQPSGSDAGTHASPRPHMRRAHWHHFWTGPMDGERKLALRWLPPIPVGVDGDYESPAVIHIVQNEKQPPP